MQFRETPWSIFPTRLEANRLIIRLQPEEGIQLSVMNKVPGGDGMNLRPANIDVSFEQAFGARYPDAYERLLMDTVRGDPVLFMRVADPQAGWHDTALGPGIVLVVRGVMAALPPALEDRVAACWAQARAERSGLFNGRVFCADEVSSDRIVGHWTEYRRVLAQLRHPELFDRLRVRSLAVNGLVECANGLVLGRRHAGAVYLPGRWQAAPAGNVEARSGSSALDLPGQVLAELDEELGLQPEEVAHLRTVAAIEHTGTHVLDVGFLLRTALSFAAVEARWARKGNDEYDALRVVAPWEVGRLLAAPGPGLLPSARNLMRRWADGR